MTLRELHLTPEAPWPGPAAYTERDTGFFHGRAAETAELHRLIHAEPVCVLYALSGLGKTSLLQAGVFPRLRADGWLPVRIRLDHRDLDDDGNPVPPLPAQVLDLVAQAAQARGISVPEWSLTEESLTTAFHERGERLWGTREDEPVTPVLVFDQFEECWTQTRDRPAARARAEALLGEVAALIDWHGNGPLQPAPVRVVFSLREDQLAPLDALRPLFPGLRRARLRLLPFTAAQATEVVEIPGGCLLDDGAAEAIVSTFASRDVDRPIADPALLSIFCWRLNEDRRSPERRADTITAARAIALRGEFVQQFYDAAFALLPPEQSLAARRFVESDLIDAAGYRSSAGFEHAEKKYGLGPGSLEMLVDARLLHPVDRSGGHRHVELVHDRIGEEAMRQRTLREEAEANTLAATQTAQLQADLSRARRRALILTALTLLALAAMGYALLMRQQAVEATALADVERDKALQARSEAETANTKTQQALAEAKVANEKTKQALAEAQAQNLEADKQRLAAEAATQAIDAEKTRADQAKDKALAAKKSADELILFMQHDLSKLLKEVGRLDMMKAVNDRIGRYHREHPPEKEDFNAQREKSVQLIEEGNIQLYKGDFKVALESYVRALDIREQLVQQEPDNIQLQRDLSVSYTKIGDALGIGGNGQAALNWYNRSLEIRQRLTQKTPNDALLLSDLSEIYERIAGVHAVAGDRKYALNLYQKSYLINKGLVRQYSGNTEWQRNLSVSHEMIGNIQLSAGDAKAALSSYQTSLAIRETFAKKEPSNSQWQEDLCVSHIKIAEALDKAGDSASALNHAEIALKIAEKLCSADASNAAWQLNLKESRTLVARLRAQRKK